MTGIDISYPAAALGGLVSFLSPCVLPLVPAYLCFVAGTSLDKLTEGDVTNPELLRRVTVSYTHLTLPTKRIV